jgi:hypothetical protein
MKLNLVLVVLFVASLMVWLLVSVAGGGGEAWDKAAYWSVGLPALYLAGGVGACLTKVSAWKLALWSGLGQFTGLLLTASGLSMWPIGLLLLALLSLPVLAVAQAARWLRGAVSG